MSGRSELDGMTIMYGGPSVFERPEVQKPTKPAFVPFEPPDTEEAAARNFPAAGVKDPEIEAIHTILDALKKLEVKAQHRVWKYCEERMREDSVKR